MSNPLLIPPSNSEVPKDRFCLNHFDVPSALLRECLLKEQIVKCRMKEKAEAVIILHRKSDELASERLTDNHRSTGALGSSEGRIGRNGLWKFCGFRPHGVKSAVATFSSHQRMRGKKLPALSRAQLVQLGSCHLGVSARCSLQCFCKHWYFLILLKWSTRLNWKLKMLFLKTVTRWIYTYAHLPGRLIFLYIKIIDNLNLGKSVMNPLRAIKLFVPTSPAAILKIIFLGMVQ